MEITISVGTHKDIILCDINPDFDDPHEIVLRKSSFKSNRTLGINTDKGSIDLNRNMIKKMQNPEQKMHIEIKGIK